MRYAWTVMLLVAAGCSSSPEPEPQSKQPAANPAASPKEQRISTLRQEIAAKRAEVAKADAELAQVDAEREKVNAQPAGDDKNNRLAELGKIEGDAKSRKAALNADIAVRQDELQNLIGGGQRAKSADEAFAEMDAAQAQVEAERKAKQKAKDDAERAAEADKLKAAEAARLAEEKARQKELVKGEGNRAAAGGEGEDGQLFEERWADVILKVRIELQKYKRW